MKYIVAAIAMLVIAVASFSTIKRVSPISWGWWGMTNTHSGVALDGYDAVAYFDDGQALQGASEFSLDWADATWHFKSAANRDKFAADPDAFAPQFGGFCSFAVSKGVTANPTTDAWHIHDGKLYVFADEDVRDEWVASIESGSLKKSEQNWAQR